MIGLELGSVWRRLGAKVTVVEYLDQILPGFDGDVRKEAQKIFKKQCMEFKLSTKVTGVTVAGDTATLNRRAAAGGAAETITADAVLLAIGRKPNTDGLNLESRGPVGQRARVGRWRSTTTSRPAWPASGRSATSHPADARAQGEDEGIAVAENIAGLTGIVNHDVIPSVVYTMPEFAGVGLTEDAAAKAMGEIKVGKFPMMANSRAKDQSRARRLREDHSPMPRPIAVVGVWAIASVAGTMIAQAAQAMEFGATSEDIAYTCHAHPTHSEAIKEAAMAVTGKPIHI